MHEKEKAWKEKQRRDGVREEDLKPLPELVEAEKKSKLAQQKIVNGNQFPRKNLSAVSADLRPIDSTESERVDQLNREGLNLLESVKVSKLVSPSVTVFTSSPLFPIAMCPLWIFPGRDTAGLQL